MLDANYRFKDDQSCKPWKKYPKKDENDPEDDNSRQSTQSRISMNKRKFV